jgi:hypothetical protein
MGAQGETKPNVPATMMMGLAERQGLYLWHGEPGHRQLREANGPQASEVERFLRAAFVSVTHPKNGEPVEYRRARGTDLGVVMVRGSKNPTVLVQVIDKESREQDQVPAAKATPEQYARLVALWQNPGKPYEAPPKESAKA